MDDEELVKITYRGWPGHFICGDRCEFHLNTLLERKDVKIVVSTVGMMRTLHKNKYEELGHNRYFETMAFHAKKDGVWYDADVERQIDFESEWAYPSPSDEWNANKGHWKVVEEICYKMANDMFEPPQEER